MDITSLFSAATNFLTYISRAVYRAAQIYIYIYILPAPNDWRTIENNVKIDLRIFEHCHHLGLLYTYQNSRISASFVYFIE